MERDMEEHHLMDFKIRFEVHTNPRDLLDSRPHATHFLLMNRLLPPADRWAKPATPVRPSHLSYAELVQDIVARYHVNPDDCEFGGSYVSGWHRQEYYSTFHDQETFVNTMGALYSNTAFDPLGNNTIRIAVFSPRPASHPRCRLPGPAPTPPPPGSPATPTPAPRPSHPKTTRAPGPATPPQARRAPEEGAEDAAEDGAPDGRPSTTPTASRPPPDQPPRPPPRKVQVPVVDLTASPGPPAAPPKPPPASQPSRAPDPSAAPDADPRSGTGPGRGREVLADASLYPMDEAEDAPREEQPEAEDYADPTAYEEELGRWKVDNTLSRFRDEQLAANCTQFDAATWKQVCAFFHHPEPSTSPDYCCTIAGAKKVAFHRKLLPVQLHAVFYILQQMHGVAGSAFVCHTMGIGKTTIILAVFYLQYVFNQIWDDVNKGPLRHAEDTPGRCKSHARILRDFGYDCPCRPQSGTGWLRPKLGSFVVLAPLGLLQVWQREFAACFADAKELLLARAHGKKGSIDGSMLDLLRGSEQKRPADQPARFNPTLPNSRVLVLSTADSLDTHFITPLMHAKHIMIPQADTTRTAKRRPKGQNQYVYTQETVKHDDVKQDLSGLSAIFSTVVKDEFQLRTGATMACFERIYDVLPAAHAQVLSVLPLSGTPLLKGPGDLQPWVRLMQRESWAAEPVLSLFRKDEKLVDLAKTWDSWIKYTIAGDVKRIVKETPQTVFDELSPLVRRLMIRWTTRDQVMDQLPVRVPENRIYDVFVKHPPASAALVRNMRETELAKAQATADSAKREHVKRHGSTVGYNPADVLAPNHYYRSRLCSSLPFLATLTRDDQEGSESLKLTDGEYGDNVRDGIWQPETESDPYFANLDAIVASSGKMTELEAHRKKWLTVKDAEGKLTRQIFSSCFFVGTYVMYLYFKYRCNVKAEDMIFVHKGLRQSKINSELARFSVDLKSDVDPAAQTTARYIFAVSSCFAVGITLIEAHDITFLEPDIRPDTIAQGMARHCRQGNRNPIVESRIWHDEESAVENTIRERNRHRGEIAKVVVHDVDKDKPTEEGGKADAGDWMDYDPSEVM